MPAVHIPQLGLPPGAADATRVGRPIVPGRQAASSLLLPSSSSRSAGRRRAQPQRVDRLTLSLDRRGALARVGRPMPSRRRWPVSRLPVGMHPALRPAAGGDGHHGRRRGLAAGATVSWPSCRVDATVGQRSPTPGASAPLLAAGLVELDDADVVDAARPGARSARRACWRWPVDDGHAEASHLDAPTTAALVPGARRPRATHPAPSSCATFLPPPGSIRARRSRPRRRRR